MKRGQLESVSWKGCRLEPCGSVRRVPTKIALQGGDWEWEEDVGLGLVVAVVAVGIVLC